MKKYVLVLSFVLLFISPLLPFKAEAKKQSFLHDRTKTYTHLFIYYDGNRATRYQSTYAFDQQSGHWKGKGDDFFWEYETKDVYTIGSHGGTDGEIKRNLKKGERIFTKTPSNLYFTGAVISTKATVKTKAGTFKNCVWIAKERASLYYAPRHGIIKVTDEKGRTIKELIKVSKRR